MDYNLAFDTINHSIRVEKLKLHHLDMNKLQVLRKYTLISNGQHVVKVNIHVYSNLLQLKVGVPQGSIIGRFYFMLYSV